MQPEYMRMLHDIQDRLERLETVERSYIVLTGTTPGVTLTINANTTITGGGTLALGGFTLTVPATGTVDLLGTAQTITAKKTFSTSANTDYMEFSGGPTYPLTIRNFSDILVDIRAGAMRIGAMTGTNTANGARVQLFNNAYTSFEGQLLFDCGNDANSQIIFRTNNGSTTSMVCDLAGDVTIYKTLTVVPTNATTNATDVVQIIGHNSTGTPATNFAGALKFQLESSTTADQDAMLIEALWSTATHASRRAFAKFSVYDTAVRECLRLATSGSASMLSFHGASAIAKPAAYTLTGSATRTMPTDPSGAYTGIDNAQAGTVYATVANLNTLRTAVSSLIGVMRQVLTDLGTTSGYGLLQ